MDVRVDTKVAATCLTPYLGVCDESQGDEVAPPRTLEGGGAGVLAAPCRVRLERQEEALAHVPERRVAQLAPRRVNAVPAFAFPSLASVAGGGEEACLRAAHQCADAARHSREGLKVSETGRVLGPPKRSRAVLTQATAACTAVASAWRGRKGSLVSVVS